MSSKSPNEDSQSTTGEIFFEIPKYSWETETQCDNTFREIPTYSWEYDTCSPMYDQDSTSTVVPNSQLFAQNQPTKENHEGSLDQNRDIDSEQPSHLAPQFDTYYGSTSNEGNDINYDHDFAQRPESPNLNLDVDAIRRELIDGLVDSPPKDDYCDHDFAQRPESPNLNLDVDAIRRELIDGFVDSPPKKKRGKKIGKWFKP